MGFTLAKRIYNQSFSELTATGINVADFEYHEPVVKQRRTQDAQPIHVTAEADLDKMAVNIKWFNPANELWYCHATAYYEDPTSWLSTWSRSARLVTSRIEELQDMAAAGTASKLKTDLAYSLFGKLVDYSDMYQTMQWVILNEDEAVAEVQFPSDTSGNWSIPPHFIDGVVSLSGFILNGGPHFDNTNNFFVTPSWKSMRFAKPLTPGARYLSYVRMVPADSHSFVGDVYILQDREIVGVVEGIVFRQWPRVMLNRFFTPPDALGGPSTKMPAAKSKLSSQRQAAFTPPSPSETSDSSLVVVSHGSQDIPTGNLTSSAQMADDSGPAGSETADRISRALELVAQELAVDTGLLRDDAQIADLGLDSLMSLVMAQRLREELRIEVRDAFFLEVSTVGDLKKLLS